MSAIDEHAGSLRGEIGKQSVAAGASDDVDAGKFSTQHLCKIGDCARVARGETFKDQAGEERLVAGDVRDGRMARCGELVVDARGHIASEEQRLGIDVDDFSGRAGGSSLDEIRDRDIAPGGGPLLHALLEQPHAVDIGMKAEAAGSRALVGVAGGEGLRRRDGLGDKRADQRPCARTDVCG